MITSVPQPTQQVGLALGTHLLITVINVPKYGARQFVLLPEDGDPSTLVLWVSKNDDEERHYVKAARELANQILRDAGRCDRRVMQLKLRED